MSQRFYIPVCVSLVLLVACTPVLPPSPLTPVPTRTPSPTPVPSPTSTVTPVPPLALTIHWPERVSAIQPVSIEVQLVPPPGVGVTATVGASVVDPAGSLYATFDLAAQEGNRYVAEEPLQLPLDPLEGEWRLLVSVRSTLDVEGQTALDFRPAEIPFRDLTADLPAGVDLRVPRDFVEAAAQGDPWAGGRVWRYGDGEIALWWAPGPLEPLLLNSAVVMLETTHDPDAPPRVLDVEEREWQGQTAFLFYEDWPAAQPGPHGGPAEAVVVQGPDYWLYVLRVRTTGGEAIPPLLRQVWQTFAFVEE